MSLYDQTIPTFLHMLANLRAWLGEAEEMATARQMDPQLLLAARLYPDMFDLTRQIQSACDAAKLTGARLAEVDAPVHDDGSATLDELRTRIGDVEAFLGGLDRAAVDAAATRDLSPGFLRGKSITATDYVRQFAIPNFFFHIVTAYGILRTSGVRLGKQTYIGDLNLKDAS